MYGGMLLYLVCVRRLPELLRSENLEAEELSMDFR